MSPYDIYNSRENKYITSQKHTQKAPRYNLKLQKLQSSPYLSKCTPPFCDELPKGNQDLSSKGGSKEHLELTKSARNAWNSMSTSTKTCLWAAWTVITVSSILRKEAPLKEEVSGGLTVAMGSTYSLAIGSPEVGGWDAAPVEDSTQGRLELTLIWATLCLRKVALMGAIITIGSDAGKSSKPRYNKIL